MQFLKLLFKITLALILIISIGLFIYIFFPSKPLSGIHDYGNWENGTVKHILPTFNHQKLLVKISFDHPLENPPNLRLNTTLVEGSPTDPKNRFWQFYIDTLTPDTDYELQVLSSQKENFTDSWNIRTFPHPDSTIKDLTVLAYTCAGGISESVFGQEIFLEVPARQALFKRGLTFNPDIIIANGDHIYWDQESFEIGFLKKLVKFRRERLYGKLDLSKPMLSDENHDTFTKMADAQIADLYGCYFREKSVYFLPDDHDLLENDEALKDKNVITFPPKDYMLDAAKSTQKLYYPEFLVDSNQNINLTEKQHFNTNFGTIRYGKLAEFNLFDCKRNCDLEGENAVLIPKPTENWLIERMQDSTANWLFQIPSTPIGYTAGKWQEWYPDILDENGKLTIEQEKYLWQRGWFSQHQRLLSAMNQSPKTPVILQGDLHIASFGKLIQSGDLNFENNPIYIVTTAPLGSGKMGFPSAVRETPAQIPNGIEIEEFLKPIEKNGFTIIQIDGKKADFEIYLWRERENLKMIETMKPAFTKTIMSTRINTN